MTFRSHFSLCGLAITLMTLTTSPTHAGGRDKLGVEFAQVNGRSLKLDLHFPEVGKPEPVLIVYAHGGGWRSGSREDMPLLGLVKRGFAVASVDYRLSTEAQSPAQIHDIKAAIRFLRARARELGLENALPVVVAGSSAGGHLAALTGVSNGVKALEGEVGSDLTASSKVDGIISLFGASNLMTILSQSTPHGLSVRVPALDLLLGGQPEQKPELAKLSSPVTHVDANDPPLLLIHGDADPQMPYAQSVELKNAYEKAGLPVELITIPRGKHGGHEFYDGEQIDRMVTLLKQVMARDPNRMQPKYRDVSFGPHPHQLMDVYVPKEAKADEPLPVLIWYGGLWKPSKQPVDPVRFTKAGIAVVAVQSRTLTDGVEEKAQPPIAYPMNDAVRAVQFVRSKAKAWGLDASRIAVGGGSQGALPALFVGCGPDRAKSDADDPVERESSKVLAVAAFRSQPTIDPALMQQWVPGVKWGAPAFGMSFEESLQKREELLPLIRQWSPESLLHADSAPVFFENNWSLDQPAGVTVDDYKVHSPAWGLGFQELARKVGVMCYVKYPGHPVEGYQDIWDYLTKVLTERNGRGR